jgi:uncharacterized protein (TIGR02266 family)
MSYSGAQTARSARENLGRALAALQEDTNIPPDVLAVAQNIAQAVGALFDAERATGEPDGKAAVKRALGVVGQTLALLQDVRGQHRGIQMATESIAQSMSVLYPLTTQPSMRPPAPNAPIMGQVSPMSPQFGQQPPQHAYAPPQPQAAPPQPAYVPPQQAYVPPQQAYVPPQQQPSMPTQRQSAPIPATPPPAQFNAPNVAPAAFAATTAGPAGFAQPAQQPAARAPSVSPSPAAQSGYRGAPADRKDTEVNIGATTESNFFVGFSGEISEGGVFCATYNIFPKGTPVRLLVTLPGNFEKHVNGFVRFVRDPMDLTAESEPGMGVQFEGLDPEARELILRFIRKRPPMFYDE